jgi:peroxiredoxin
VFVIDRAATIRYAWVTDDTANTPDIEEVLSAVEALAQS